MGYSIVWLAVRGISYNVALERQGLLPTDQTTDYGADDVSALSIPGDWSLFVARRCNHRLISQANLESLSVNCEVVACAIEEHVMYCSSEYWSNGKRQWRVEHDFQKSFDHLATDGMLPDDFAATRARFAEQQEADGGKKSKVDMYFEIPLVLARSRVGFKHDEDAEFETEGEFQVLIDTVVPSPPPGKAWWLFGK